MHKINEKIERDLEIIENNMSNIVIDYFNKNNSPDMLYEIEGLIKLWIIFNRIKNNNKIGE